MKSELIVASDCDGVIINLTYPWLKWYNRDWKDNLKYKDLIDWDLDKLVKPECGKKIYDYLEYPGIYDEAPPIANSLNGIIHLREMGYRVIFVTSSTLGAAGRKYKWLKDNGFIDTPKDYVEATDKSLILANYLLDDYTININAFKGRGVLFSAPYNKSSLITPRVNDWKGVDRFFTREMNKYA